MNNNIKNTLSLNKIKNKIDILKNKIKNSNEYKTILYYYINPNLLYLKKSLNSYYNKTKYDFNSNPNILNPINIPFSYNKIKNNQYNILQPYNIPLSTNNKYEKKLKVVYTICIIIVLIFFFIYINYN